MVETISTDELAGTMEFFLMAAISRGGLDTLYALQQTAGLQPGSLAHVIKALMEAGRLERSEGAKRGRRAMALTEAGERFLAEEWRKGLVANREMESVLRSATVALLMGDIVTAFRFLHDSALERERRQGPTKLGEASSGKAPVDFHAEMRAVYETRRREMERDVLREFADKLMAVAKKGKEK
jgi:DNA-binding MarR family transcriptional regulator